MDYEKKYKEAQGWIEKIYPTLQHEQQMEAEAFFPELVESEDERIRESLLEYLHTLPNHYSHDGVCAPDWIAWLEKQGEKKSAWKPSDAQMQTLKEACDKYWEPDGLDPLYTLYEQLKKLKGE